MDKFNCLMQDFMEKYFSNVYNLCKRSYNWWQFDEAYRGALCTIETQGVDIQQFTYVYLISLFPEFIRIANEGLGAFSNEIHDEKEREIIFFIHSFVTIIAEKLLLYGQAKLIVDLISEADRTALTAFAVSRALVKTKQFFPNSKQLDYTLQDCIIPNTPALHRKIDETRFSHENRSRSKPQNHREHREYLESHDTINTNATTDLLKTLNKNDQPNGSDHGDGRGCRDEIVTPNKDLSSFFSKKKETDPELPKLKAVMLRQPGLGIIDHGNDNGESVFSVDITPDDSISCVGNKKKR